MRPAKKIYKPMNINDITIIDDDKLKKAITAAALGNAMEWFDFGDFFCSFSCSSIGGNSLWYFGGSIRKTKNPGDNYNHNVLGYL